MWSFFHQLVSPKKFFHLANQLLPWLYVSFLLLFAYGLVGALYLAPADYLQGDGFRIIYVHVPCAFLSLCIYAVMATAAVSSLVFRIKLGALVIKESAPIGALFTFLALITGSIWGKPMWGTWWIWDARLTSELILLFLYIGIMLFQAAISQKQQGDRALSILVLVGFIDIPIIHYSVIWWNTLHQGATLSAFNKPAIDTSMLLPLLSMIAAFLIYYAILMCVKLNHALTATANNPHWLRGKSHA